MNVDKDMSIFKCVIRSSLYVRIHYYLSDIRMYVRTKQAISRDNDANDGAGVVAILALRDLGL